MRGIQAKEQEQAETPTVQRQSESVGLSSGFDVAPPTTLPPTPKMGTGFPSVSETQIQRQCADCAFEQQEQAGEAGKDFKEIGIQTKLTIGAPGDPYEQEADQVAAQVMSMPAPPDNSASVQRRLDSRLDTNNPNQIWQRAQSIKPMVQRRIDPRVQMAEMIQRAHQIDGNQASGDLESRLNASKGGGSPLSEDVRGFMEPRFGADFSGVRVHTGGEAVQMNQELGAQAFTHGRDVFFNQGKYNPGSDEGKSLLAHELTHVVQQTGVVQRQHHKLQQPTINVKEVPILEGVAPKSNVLSHLQSLGGTAGHDSSVYRKEILQFQRENPTDKIAGSQQQVLESAKSVDIQQKDNSQTLRRCGGGGGGNKKDLKSKLTSMIASGTNYAQVKAAIQAASATDRSAVLADQALLTSLKGALPWNDFAKSVELLGRQAPDYNTLIADPTVQAALTTAWTNSNPAVPGPGTTQHEEGGWIYLNLITGNISVRHQTSGGQAAINLSNPPIVADSIVVGKFHTHPNLGPNWVHGPSSGDATVDAQHGVPDIVVASPNPPATTYYQSGPSRRLHLAGNQGLPGSAGGVAPQAKKDGSHDEQ
jgi:hypothetical protein